MKKIFIFTLVIACISAGRSTMAAWEGGSWSSDWRSQQDRRQETVRDNKKSARKYCSGTREKKLLKLLKELDTPFSDIKKMRGGRSQARWQYQMIRKLRKFDDCRAEDAIKRLSKENTCEEWGEGDAFCVKWTAEAATQEIKASADLKKLTAATPLTEQLDVIRKYGKRPYINNFAANRIADYLVRQSMRKPQIFVPLLVEFFPHKPVTEHIARRNPTAADKGILKLLTAREFDQVWWGINLARYLGKKKFLDRIFDVSFGGKGRIDYSNSDQIEEIRTAAQGCFRALRPESAKYIKQAAAIGNNAFADYCASAALGCKTSGALNRYLADIADNSDGFAVLTTIGRASGSDGNDGKDIDAILITANADWKNDRGKPTVIITGAIHGNEWATPEVCLGIASYLLANRNNSASAVDDKGALINDKSVPWPIVPKLTSIRQLLTAIQVIIIPVLNPDGYDFSHTQDGKESYYGTGWRPNRRAGGLLDKDEECYSQDGSIYAEPPSRSAKCFLADYDDTSNGGEIEEEEVMVCESVDRQTVSLFSSSLNVASTEMFDAIYKSHNPSRVLCASNQRRVWKSKWEDSAGESIAMSAARRDGYLQESYGVDLNRNFQYKWDVTQSQKNLFIRSRSPSSRVYRGRGRVSEGETRAMEKLIAEHNVVALIDYHAGSTQVLYPYAFSTQKRVDKKLFGQKWGKSDYEVFRLVSEKIAALSNRHDRGDPTIVNYTAAQNYNNVSVGSGVARDCYYQTEGIAALNIEVHDKHYTYGHEEFREIVPKICKTSVPGAVWFLFWAAELDGNRPR